MSIPLVTIALLAGSAVVPTYGQAFHRAQPLIIPIEGLFDNLDCGQELIDFTGNFHIVSQSFSEGDGFHTIVHINLANARGIGTISGNQYQITNAGNSIVNVHAGAGTTTSEVNTFHFIVLGPPTDPQSDLLVHANTHVTVNANGETTVAFSDIFAECR
jgi:hypothetical protein